MVITSKLFRVVIKAGCSGMHLKSSYFGSQISEQYGFRAALSDLRQFLAIETPLRMMKNAFYFTLKSLFVLKIFKFLSWLLVIYKNGLIRKISLIVKIFNLVNKQLHYIYCPVSQERQLDYDIWPVNRIQHEKHFCWKIRHKMWWRNYSQTLF